jgi:nucleotide-binding universal stress UspA family protein
MSQWRHILALVGDKPRSGAVLALAAHLAVGQGATVSAVHAVMPAAALTGAYLSPEAAGMALALADRGDRDRHTAAAARVAATEARFGLSMPLAPATNDPMAATLDAARASDLIVLAQPEEGDGFTPGFAASVLVRSGTPLLFVPGVDVFAPDADGAPRCGRRVLVAWSPARESTRAIRDAMPLLAAADDVALVRWADPDPTADPAAPEPMDAVCAYLRRHGVQASAHRLVRSSAPVAAGLLSRGWTPDVPVAEALLSHAADTRADLIVMGGYGHSRAWELALGGVTRTLLQSMTVPVLMSH